MDNNSSETTDVELKSDLDKLSKHLQRYNFADNLEQVNQVITDFTEPFKLMIVGEGKFGKSTLINALLGRNDDIAEVGRVPKTWTVDIFHRNSTKEIAEIFYNGGKIVEKSIPEVKAFIADSKRNNVADSKVIEKNNIFQIKWHISAQWPTGNLDLVDTPGFAQIKTSDIISKINLFGGEGIELLNSDDAFWYYYYRADMVLWCIRADRLQDADTMKMFIKADVQKKNVVGVITYADKIPSSQESHIISEANRLYGGFLNEICLFNGLKTNSQDYAKEIRRIIDDKYSQKLELIKRKAKERFIKNQKLFLSDGLYKIFECLENNLDKYYRITNKFSTLPQQIIPLKISDIKKLLEDEKMNAISRVSSFYDAVGGNSEAFAAEIKNKAINYYSISNGFRFISESFQGNLNAELASSAKDLAWQGISIGEKEIKQYTVTIKFDNARYSNNNTCLHLDIDPMNGIGTGLVAGSIAAYAGSFLLGPIGLIAGGIGILVGMFTRKSKHTEAAEKAIRNTFTELKKQYEEQFSKNMKNIFSNIYCSIDKSFKQHHGMSPEQIFNLSRQFDETYNTLNLFENEENGIRYSFDVSDFSTRTVFKQRLLKYKSEEQGSWDQKIKSFVADTLTKALEIHYEYLSEWGQKVRRYIKSRDLSQTNIDPNEITGYKDLMIQGYKSLKYISDEKLKVLRNLYFADSSKVFGYFETEAKKEISTYRFYANTSESNLKREWQQYVSSIIDNLIKSAFSLTEEQVAAWEDECHIKIKNSDLKDSDLNYKEIPKYLDFIADKYEDHIYFTADRLSTITVLKCFNPETHLEELTRKYKTTYNSYHSKLLLRQRRIRESWDINILDKWKQAILISFDKYWHQGGKSRYGKKPLKRQIRMNLRFLVPKVKTLIRYNQGKPTSINFATRMNSSNLGENIKNYLNFTDIAITEAKDVLCKYKLYHVSDTNIFFNNTYNSNMNKSIRDAIEKFAFRKNYFPYLHLNFLYSILIILLMFLIGLNAEIIVYTLITIPSILLLIFFIIRIRFELAI